ncbi:YSC84-related protein [Cupriavidus taiwanensis]|uniref:Lipoprotein n=2 Tax=Cupriavidus taiwanensis TaxID=164546 RepID=B2AH70_CUPTR|nr:YSC84-related protein [Cupriavidus taiwanensis]CAP63119.1 putative lipoprotein [Cupriavidus taiwanensis LMG 19424]SOY54708.1 putative lipoprotein [Cupriavidus taiwanensis]SOY87237.1 putative lipoprotein [Cupriavidus taiwanensis]SOZ01376.1 putative lipoprotein [Cupriavidus taiwanensis]SOZ04280.1 putative lipoprotein [Cupriavidus taiwanensis]
MNRRHFVTRVAGSGLLVATAMAAGCTTTGTGASKDPVAKKQEIDAGVDGALNRLFSSANGSRELAQRAQGILVFPRVLAGGFIVGAEYGEGALRSKGATVGYYSTTQASVGLTAGGQSKAVIIMFMTPEAYNKFVASKGWTAGADANVAVAKIGADGRLDTLTSQQPVIAFVQTNAGLMFDVSVNGSKISKLDI